MIKTLEELISDVFYDWGFCPDPQIVQEDEKGQRAFLINKTYIYPRDGKFYLSYKKEMSEVSQQAFNEFTKLYDLMQNDAEVNEKMNRFHEVWLDADLDKDQDFQELLTKIRGKQ